MPVLQRLLQARLDESACATGYALAVAVGAIAVTAAVTRFDRKHVLLGLTVLFVAGNLISAVATDFEVMLAGRVVAALNHGAFFGIGSVVAAGLVAPAKKAAAISLMFAGLTAANVFGVPLGTLVGHRSSQVWLSLAVTVLGFGGMFGAFTYIAYILTEVSGFAASTIPWLLVVFGIARRSPGCRCGSWATPVMHPHWRPAPTSRPSISATPSEPGSAASVSLSAVDTQRRSPLVRC